VRWTAYAALRTENNTAGHGAQAWSLSVAARGARVADVTTDGTIVPQFFAGMGNDFQRTEVVDPLVDTGSGPQGEGAVSTIASAAYPQDALLQSSSKKWTDRPPALHASGSS
jgi:hypothetical protein